MNNHKKWLITGAAGFIGSHLADRLLNQGHQVLGLDNFNTGLTTNVERLNHYGKLWQFLNVDIRENKTINKILDSYRPDFVAHLAAQVSVPLSISQPFETQDINVNGFLNVILAAKERGVKRFIYASSSAVYGEQFHLPITETAELQPLSLYGLSKKLNEEYAALYADNNFYCIGLRLFNIFGLFQRDDSPYSGVIAKWFKQLQSNHPITVYGDGNTTRDFCYVDNVVTAIEQLSQTSLNATHRVYNIGTGHAITLNQLSDLLLNLTHKDPSFKQYAASRAGDILHSQADIALAIKDFNYRPTIDIEMGLRKILLL